MANSISLGRRTVTIVPDGSTNFDITTIQSNMFRMLSQSGAFAVGEAVTQAGSGATGVVRRWDPVSQLLYLDSMTGTFDATNVVTGAISAAHGIPFSVQAAFPNGIRLSDVRFGSSGANDKLIIRDRIATGPIIYSVLDTSGGGKHQGVGGRSWKTKPFILASEQVYSDVSKALIILEYD